LLSCGPRGATLERREKGAARLRGLYVWGRSSMITYRRSQYYGLNYFFHLRGSVLPRAIPPAVLACLFNWAILEGHIKMWDESSDEILAHPYTFQLVGLVFGYLTVYRISISYNRYWEGVTMVKNMHSKWADACGQVIAFDRSKSGECNLTSDPFCCHVVRLFSQMSAMATMRLHVVEAGESMLFEALEATDTTTAQLSPLEQPAQSERSSERSPRLGRDASNRGSRSRIVAPDPNAEARIPSVTLDKAMHAAAEQSAKVALGTVAAVADRHTHHDHAHHKQSKTEKVHELAAGITAAERNMLLSAPCPVFATAMRIQRAIITRLHAGGMRAPPPIVSRIFQEISNGLLAYNNATKMKEIPVPFAYVQLNALFLNLFAIFLCPVAIASFTPTVWLSLTTTAVTVISFFAVFIVANEMEDPFGTEANDMPMLAYHEEFCASLCSLMTTAWLPEDQWLVDEGRWVPPRTVGLAANAFFDSINSNKSVKIAKRQTAVPAASLLNRAKATGSKVGRSKSRLVKFWRTVAGRGGGGEEERALPHFVQQGAPIVSQAKEENDMAIIIQRATRRKSSATRKLMREYRDGETEGETQGQPRVKLPPLVP